MYMWSGVTGERGEGVTTVLCLTLWGGIEGGGGRGGEILCGTCGDIRVDDYAHYTLVCVYAQGLLRPSLYCEVCGKHCTVSFSVKDVRVDGVG